MVGFYRILANHYYRFLESLFPKFRSPISFRWVINNEKIIYRKFHRVKGVFFSPVFTRGLKLLNFWNFQCKPVKLNGMRWQFESKFSFQPFCFQKETEIYEIFRNRLDFLHCLLRFFDLTLIFYKRKRRIHFPNAYPQGELQMWLPANSQASFGGKSWKPRDFQSASVTLSHFSGVFSQVWHLKNGSAMKADTSIASVFNWKLPDFSTKF